MNKVLALILAGGRGQRMGALCRTRPKPLLPFGSQYRVIDFTLSNCIHSGINDIYALVDFQHQPAVSYLRDWARQNSVSNLKVLPPVGETYRGTADAVRRNLELVRNFRPDAVLVLAADHIYRMDYREMISFHAYFKADVTMAVRTVPIWQASRFGIVTVDERNRVTRFVEKPDAPQGNLASMGIYVFKPDKLIAYLEDVERFPNLCSDFGNDLIPHIVNQDNVAAYGFNHYWQDVGTIGAYFKSNMDLLSRPPRLSLDSNRPVLAGCPGLIPVVSTDLNVENSIVGCNCVIEGLVEDSIVGDNVRVGRHAVVRNSIIFSNADIGEYSLIDHCVVDDDVKVEKFCYLGRPWVLHYNTDITVLNRGQTLSQYDSLLLNYRKTTSLDIGYLTNGHARTEQIIAR